MSSKNQTSKETIFTIRNARPDEFKIVGQLMFDVYSNLEGFPKPKDQPKYFDLLLNVGELTTKPEIEIIVAVNSDDKIVGGVVYFGEMKYYGSGGAATQELNASGFRLLAVSEEAQGRGIGKLLTMECIRRAQSKNHRAVVIHTTMAMQNAWRMYERIGFIRQTDLDFMQGELQVFGFRYLFVE